ncbi:MAG: DUF2029 domain-containing protein [Acetobacteraceae bacterium]|nr:DUF2029 domain-containing protein [Acetobacteraceae bacterium]
MRRPLLRLAALGAALFACMAGALALHVPGADTVGSIARTNVFVAVLAVGSVLYLASVHLVVNTRLPRGAIWLVLGVAVGMRAMLLPAPPFLSSDIYRYVWDGQVQAAGINPYRYVPADPALASLRDPAVFPLINRADWARTIYPPGGQAIFVTVGEITRTVLGMKLAMAAFDVVAMLCAMALLAQAGLPQVRLLIYAWNPLVLWAFACDGHVDAAAIGLLAVALLCRARRKLGVAGAVLAAAALVKLLPVAVAPAFLRKGRVWRPALAGFAVVAVLYAAYLSAGWHVLGFLPAYGQEEGLASGDGIWLLNGLSHLFALPDGAAVVYALAAVALFAWLSAAIAGDRLGAPANEVTTLCRDTAILAACATVAISPHYFWYFAWLAWPSVVAPMPAVIWLSVAPIALYIDPLHERFVWPSLVYVPAAVLALSALRRRRVLSRRTVITAEGSS